jgi:hypothetical protein
VAGGRIDRIDGIQRALIGTFFVTHHHGGGWHHRGDTAITRRSRSGRSSFEPCEAFIRRCALLIDETKNLEEKI